MTALPLQFGLIKKFAAYYGPHKKLFLADMSCAFMIAVCNLFYPIIVRNIIDSYVPNQLLGPLLGGAAALFCIYLLKAWLNWFVQYYGHLMGVRIQTDMRRDAFEHLQSLPFSYFDRTQTGSIMSRVIGDTFEIAELAHHGPEDLFISAVTLVGSFILLFSMNAYLTAIIFAFVPFLVWFAARMRRTLSDTSMRARREIGEVNADLQNSIAGVRVAKAFATASRELSRFQIGNKSYESARGDQYRAMAEFSSGTGLILDLLLLITLLSGGIFAYRGQIGAGEFAAYLLFVGLFTEPIKKLINFIEQLQTGMTGFARVQELMAAKPEADAGELELTNARGEISFEDVSFRYDEGRHVLKDISLRIEPGKTVALVGPSGGGKSTLCHLLPRFYELDCGRISIDGRDIRDYTLPSLRGSIGIVQQDTFLFAGTIRENIAYGDFDATDEQVTLAAKRAGIDGFVQTLENGYDTRVGERGVTLSGGQKQRVAIARVFLKNPRILILDEATSALDNESELHIQRALEELSAGRTTLVVAHRLSTIRDADRIVVLTAEGIEEQGSHKELMAREGLYAKLWHTQSEERPATCGG